MISTNEEAAQALLASGCIGAVVLVLVAMTAGPIPTGGCRMMAPRRDGRDLQQQQ